MSTPVPDSGQNCIMYFSPSLFFFQSPLINEQDSPAVKLSRQSDIESVYTDTVQIVIYRLSDSFVINKDLTATDNLQT